MFDISNMPISILMSQINFVTVRLNLFPKISSCQHLLKFSTFDISNILILVLMLKMIFIKQSPPVSPKSVPKLKVARIYSNLTYLIFQIR